MCVGGRYHNRVSAAAPMIVYAAGQLKCNIEWRPAGSGVIVPRPSTRRGALRRRVNQKRKKKMDDQLHAAAWLDTQRTVTVVLRRLFVS